MSKPYLAVQYGIGPIGAKVVELAVNKGIEFVGAVDIDPNKVGTTLSEVTEVGGPNVTVTDNPSEALAAKPDIVFHTTTSHLEPAVPQLTEILECGADVISTTEELSYPWERHPALARKLDEAATANNATCIGTGINPGFIMDTAPALLSTPFESIDGITIKRIQNASNRRGPLQQKVGAGLSKSEFQTNVVEQGGHVGCRESIFMLANAIGWEIDSVTETIEPVIVNRLIETDHVSVEPGQVAGIKQIATGSTPEDRDISLNLQMYVGAEQTYDRIIFDGNSKCTITVDEGFPGDVATAAVVTNLASTICEEPSGLKNMTDIRVPSFKHIDQS